MNPPRLTALLAPLLGLLLALDAAAAQSQPAPTPSPTAAPLASPASSPSTGTPPATPGTAAPGTTAPAAPGTETPPSEIVVQGAEPRYVARTTRDRIGRIWAPVFIDGKGPFRLVLDTGATHSAVIPSTAAALGNPSVSSAIVVTGFTGSAVVPTIAVHSMEVGELLLGPTTLPVVADVFGGAQGVLGPEGLQGKRIVADFTRDRLQISRSHGDPAKIGFSVVQFKLLEGLPIADIKVGGIHCKAIIDTGAQGTVGNLPLREALTRRPPRLVNKADIEGVTLDVQSGDSLPAPQIQMGSLTINGVHIIFGDMYLFQHWHMTDKPVLLLGMDLLGSFDVLIIDYRMREMQVRLTRAQL
ncbi:MAG: aspartyl protease family protein [Steroidobacteraceae bacterium]